MASPQSGNPGNAVSPAAPTDAQPAANADPGQMYQIQAEQMEAQNAKYESTPVKPFKPAKFRGVPDKDKPTHWIEIVLVGEDNKPIPGEPYQITLPDGETVAAGTTDEKGFARVAGIDSGTCKITFPQRDKEAWEKA